MLRLNAQIGFNPLRHHRPYQCIRTQNNYYSLGQNGEIVVWKSDCQPVYQIIPSINADTDKLIAFSVTPLRLISSEQKSMKIVTIHEDGRLRIFNATDGLCVNVSTHYIFPQKINGIVQNQQESRFILCFSQQKIYIFDIWIMKVIDWLQLSIQSFSIFVRGRITQNLQLQMMDKQGKMFRFNTSTLYSDNLLDVGSYVSNALKAFQIVQNVINQMKNQKTISSYKKIPQKHSLQALQQIKNQLIKLNQVNIWEDIFNQKFTYIPCINQIIKQNQIPTISNLCYLKGNKLWYFFGTSTGKVFGLPAIFNGLQQIIVHISELNNGPVAYIQFLDNLMIISWMGGLFNVYTVDNLQFTINQQLALVKKSKNQVCYVSPEKNKIFSKKMSAQVKYKLDIYNVNKGKVGLQIFGFQLINNQVFIFDTIHKKCINFRGLSQDSRIFTIFQYQDYLGIAHKNGVDMYSGDRFQRKITYDKWIWSDFEFCERAQWNQDYHNIGLKKQQQTYDFSKIDGISLIKFCDRFHKKKLDFYSLSSDLCYETFGLIEDGQIHNEMYPTFHFIQKVYTQKIIHSICTQNATSVLKMKLQNIRRDKSDNVSFFLTLNLNKQLQVWNEDNTKIDEIIDRNFSLFSLFFWDQNFIPYLTQLYANSEKKFIFKRRYVEQGIGKSFTLYFDNHSKHYLSQSLLTLSALSSTAFLQILASKDIQLTDSMVQTVQFFTTKRQNPQNKINPQLLSRMCLSQSSFILKVCINLLMSTALTQYIPLHPIYQYFILNLKNLQQNKIKELSEAQAVWITYLGVGLIYSQQIFDKQQLKVLIGRILNSLQVKNFQLHQDLVIVVLKVLNEGIKKWKNLINSGTIIKLYTDLFKIFFLYDGLIHVSQDDKKFDFRFQKISPNQSKKMKLQIVKTIVYLSKQFSNQFLQVLRIQALNQKPHPAYPSSVVQILRQYLKTQKPNTNLVFYVQLLLQCLSPMTPQLRKYVQKNVLQTLQIMCSYQTISFNHTSQKLSVRTDSNIYIYCLRTSTKWRTITIKQQLPPQMSVLKMSPKGTYIALLGDKLKIWRLSSGFWSGVLGAFSQGWTFQVKGKALKWDDSQQSITVINQNPSLNKCFKL